MPWKQTEPMSEKERFAVLAQTGRFTVMELCAEFGSSRKTGHKYLKRYRSEGRDGLQVAVGARGAVRMRRQSRWKR